MHERILIAGSGGQGCIFVGKLLARVAVRAVPYVTFLPAYGAEVRGGTSYCQIILSSDEIASPLAEEQDSLLVMNPASASRFLPSLSKTGLGIMNVSLCRQHNDQRLVWVRATELADQAGNAQVANLVMLGAWLARRPVIVPQAVEQELELYLRDAKPSLRDLNLRAFHLGVGS